MPSPSPKDFSKKRAARATIPQPTLVASRDEALSAPVWGVKLGLAPVLVLALVAILCHGFILTNDGPIWDGWYWVHWLKTRDWAPMIEYTDAQGLPTTLWLFGLFAFTPDPVAAGMIANFLCLFAESLLVCKITLVFSKLTRWEAVGIGALSLAIPLFNAAQDFPVVGLVFFRLLFLVAALLGAWSVQPQTPFRHVLRVVSVTLFFLVCLTNGALLVFYGGFWLLLFYHFKKIRALSFMAGVRRFLLEYPDYLLLPPFTWVFRSCFIKQFGWYETYNKPSANLPFFWANLGTFFNRLLPFHIKQSGVWIQNNGFVFGGLIALCLAAYFLLRKRRSFEWSLGGHLALAGFGLVLLSLAVVPLALVGKAFEPNPVSLHSRHCLLFGIPLAILLFSLVRWLTSLAGPKGQDWTLPGVLFGVLFGAIQLNGYYLNERMTWLYQHSALHNAANNKTVRESSVIFLRNHSTTGLLIYDLYAAAGQFGKMSRYVTPNPPENGRFYTPREIYINLHMTSVIPNEYNQISPSGRQLLVDVKRTPLAESPWGAVLHYFRRRVGGDKAAFETYLASLTTLQLGVIRESALLIPGIPKSTSERPEGLPERDFSNGLGMAMVKTPPGWWAGKYEVTQRQFEALTGKNPSLFKDPERPVECVSWNAATAFCQELTKSEAKAGRLPTGFVYRLPTAAEWDFMANGTKYADGVLSLTEPLWQTEPVGGKPANLLGLHDITGNVWEWCEDWGDAKRLFKVSKGGAWLNDPSSLSPYSGPKEGLHPLAVVATDRFFGSTRKDYPDQGFWDRGFRCILARPLEDKLLK